MRIYVFETAITHILFAFLYCMHSCITMEGEGCPLGNLIVTTATCVCLLTCNYQKYVENPQGISKGERINLRGWTPEKGRVTKAIIIESFWPFLSCVTSMAQKYQAWSHSFFS